MGFIFEREIENIIHTVRARTIGERELTTLGDILKAPIYPAIKAYFKQKVVDLLQNERDKELRSRRFGYGLPEVVSLQRHIDLLLVRLYQFDQQEFGTLADEAVHFEFNFLCRPQWTMMGFIFENRATIPSKELEKKLNYCVDYPYYAKILLRYYGLRGVTEIEYSEFKHLLEKVDHELTLRHTGGELAAMLKPLFRFVEVAQSSNVAVTGEPIIPLNAAIAFYEDKHLEALKAHLETHRDRIGIADITMAQLVTFVAEHYRREQPRISSLEPISEVALDRTSLEVLDDISGKSMTAPEPTLEPKTEEQLLDDTPSFERIVTSPPTIPPLKPASTLGLLNLFDLLTPDDEMNFSQKLFRKDVAKFRQFVELLNIVRQWTEAAAMIDKMFIENGIDPFSSSAIEFTDLVQRRFLTRNTSQERNS
jgi:hypothetical protein